jgi:hypothetical protein
MQPLLDELLALLRRAPDHDEAHFRNLCYRTTLACALTHAAVKLPAVFGNGMVLQRDNPVAVWGTA